MKLRYHNFLTTPSGRKCELYEINNENYLVLVKFCEAKDYKSFYHALDLLIKESIPDFDEYNIIDKAYVYLAYCYYSIHDSIVYKLGTIQDYEISIATILDNIEQAYKDIKKEYKLTNTVSIQVSIPRTFIIENEDIFLEIASGIDSINGIEFKNNQQRIDFIKTIDVKYGAKLEQLILRDFSLECALYKNPGPFSTKTNKTDIISPQIFHDIFQIYREPLEDYYKILYYNFEYLKLSYNTYMQLTPRESRFIFHSFAEDKERQAAEQQSKLMGGR